MKRETYRLAPAERLAFAKLRPLYDASSVFRFWWAVARARCLDGTTIIGMPGDPHAFTALPLDHGKHWCWPKPLNCKKSAATLEQEDEDRYRAPTEFCEDRGGVRFASLPRAIFCYGDTIFNPSGNKLSDALVAHEAAHGARQGTDPDVWWDRYIADKTFRLEEEIVAHRVEWRRFCTDDPNRHERRRYLAAIAGRLNFPLIIEFQLSYTLIAFHATAASRPRSTFAGGGRGQELERVADAAA
jgi:hypothetical protein